MSNRAIFSNTLEAYEYAHEAAHRLGIYDKIADMNGNRDEIISLIETLNPDDPLEASIAYEELFVIDLDQFPANIIVSEFYSLMRKSPLPLRPAIRAAEKLLAHRVFDHAIVLCDTVLEMETARHDAAFIDRARYIKALALIKWGFLAPAAIVIENISDDTCFIEGRLLTKNGIAALLNAK